MFENKSDYITIAIIAIIIIIIGLLGFWAFSVYSSNTSTPTPIASDQPSEPETPVNNNNNDANKVANTVVANTIAEKPVINAIDSSAFAAQTGTSGGGTTSQKTYKGFVMVGYIEIPKTGIKYPILEEATKKSIETSVAILYGPGLNKPGNTVIVGHNYRNGMFFSDNYKIAVGDKIYITDSTGNRVTYIVYAAYETTPEDSEFMTRDTHGGVEISLSTCTDDSSARTIIWARAEQQ
ncbi:MAG: sortase [Clostridia bacterium]|nr:sortase [Clostridia bacterium]